jgi:hypothetical protein
MASRGCDAAIERFKDPDCCNPRAIVWRNSGILGVWPAPLGQELCAGAFRSPGAPSRTVRKFFVGHDASALAEPGAFFETNGMEQRDRYLI